jgi:hypothetical protein
VNTNTAVPSHHAAASRAAGSPPSAAEVTAAVPTLGVNDVEEDVTPANEPSASPATVSAPAPVEDTSPPPNDALSAPPPPVIDIAQPVQADSLAGPAPESHGASNSFSSLIGIALACAVLLVVMWPTITWAGRHFFENRSWVRWRSASPSSPAVRYEGGNRVGGSAIAGVDARDRPLTVQRRTAGATAN